jgi:hypothetical protein
MAERLTADELEHKAQLIDHMIGAARSDLDALRLDLKTDEADKDGWARLAVYAESWRSDAEQLTEDARAIFDLAHGHFYDDRDRGPIDEAYRRRVNERLRESMYDVEETPAK